jgi:hypothetical protein
MRTRLEQIQGARIQYRALFRQMATVRGNFHFYDMEGDLSGSMALMHAQATWDVMPANPEPIVRNVQGMAEQTFVNALSAAFDRNAYGM